MNKETYNEIQNELKNLLTIHFERLKKIPDNKTDAYKKGVLDCKSVLKNYFTFRQPTFSDCIKEWEERGYSVNDYGREIIIESEKYDLDITICKANLIYEISNYYRDKPACISPELHQLLSKTIKALENNNETK